MSSIIRGGGSMTRLKMGGGGSGGVQDLSDVSTKNNLFKKISEVVMLTFLISPAKYNTVLQKNDVPSF